MEEQQPRMHRSPSARDRCVALLAVPPEQRDAEEIYELLRELLPTLFKGLAHEFGIIIAAEAFIRPFVENEVILGQGDAPSVQPYYCVVFDGLVSVYARGSDAPTHNEKGEINHGKFLVQLGAGTGFGELAFLDPGKESSRAASVVASRKDHGGDSADGPSKTMVLMISQDLYSRTLFTMHSLKYQFGSHMQFLKTISIFEEWPRDSLIKLAYAIVSKSYGRGETVLNHGDDANYVHVIKSGSMRLSIPHHRDRDDPYFDKHRVIADTSVEVAVLQEGDVVGVVEAMKGMPASRANIVAEKPSIVYCIPCRIFTAVVMEEVVTKTMLDEVIKRRTEWESLRLQYTIDFADSKMAPITPDLMEVAKYNISATTSPMAKKRAQSEVRLTSTLREISNAMRGAAERERLGKYDTASSTYANVLLLCDRGQRLAKDCANTDQQSSTIERFKSAATAAQARIAEAKKTGSLPVIQIEAQRSARRGSISVGGCGEKKADTPPPKRAHGPQNSARRSMRRMSAPDLSSEVAAAMVQAPPRESWHNKIAMSVRQRLGLTASAATSSDEENAAQAQDAGDGKEAASGDGERRPSEAAAAAVVAEGGPRRRRSRSNSVQMTQDRLEAVLAQLSPNGDGGESPPRSTSKRRNSTTSTLKRRNSTTSMGVEPKRPSEGSGKSKSKSKSKRAGPAPLRRRRTLKKGIGAG